MYQDLSILLFGHTRPTYIADVLESLSRQGAVSNVDIWLDGHQSSPDIRYQTELVRTVVDKYQVRSVNAHNGQIGFRKLILHALDSAASDYRYIIVLEDDCFPTRDAISIFVDELALIEHNDRIFSVYGHPFLVPAEGETITRFQGWGWATTSEKLKPYIDKLIYLYSLREHEYLQYVDRTLTLEVVKKLDVTPQRQPSEILRRFYAWDETLALLAVLSDQVHKKTKKRTVYNFGASENSSRFKDINWFLRPPYNMVRHEDIWDYF